jgi:hypothetical protein
MPSGRKPKQYPQETVDAIERLYENGKTQHEVAEEMGMSQKVVFNVMRRHGLRARVAAKREQRGECNASWKGNNAGKQALHRRLYAKHGKPNKCSKCGTTSAHHYDYANLTGRYANIDDYAAMCRSCHWKYDTKINNIKHMRRDADDQAKST